jgi:hypothetical protein
MCTLLRTYLSFMNPEPLTPETGGRNPYGARFCQTLICLDLVSFNFPHQRLVATFEGSEPTVSMSAFRG